KAHCKIGDQSLLRGGSGCRGGRPIMPSEAARFDGGCQDACMPARRRLFGSSALFAGATAFSAALLFTLPALAANFDVDGDLSLRAAILAAGDGDSITFTGNITLLGDLPAVQRNVTIDGNSFTLSGNNQFRGLF